MTGIWKAAIIILIIGALFLGFYYLVPSPDPALKSGGLKFGNEVVLPVIAIVGVILMLSALAGVSLLFAKSQLQDKTQALGLPEGSIRAVIALSLIVLFAILTVFLYGNISRPSVYTLEGLTDPQKNEYIAVVPRDRIVGVFPEEGNGLYTILIEVRNPAGDDFAKQLLVLLGTLVTSIASFYFGAKAGAAGAPQTESETSASLSIRGILPATRKADGSTAEMEISGDNLGLVKDVKIVSGSNQILASDVLSNDSVIKCNLAVPASAPPGAWDVIVTDSAGTTAKLAGGLTITA